MTAHNPVDSLYWLGYHLTRMFEQQARSQKSKRWTYFPIAGVVFVAIVAFMLVLGRPDPQLREPVTGVLQAGDPDYEWYSRHMNLENRSIKMAKSLAGQRMVIFTGVIDNGGEKPLDVVEIKLTLFNQDEPVFTAVKTPIRPGPYTPPIPSLKSRAFTVYLDEFPSKWRASRAEMEIHGFRFAAGENGTR